MEINFRVQGFIVFVPIEVMYLFFRGEIYHQIVCLCSIGILLSIRAHMGSLR